MQAFAYLRELNVEDFCGYRLDNLVRRGALALPSHRHVLLR